jgi:FtsZ-interacting cell division protein ZipA
MKINIKKVIICITICILTISVIVICTVRKENNSKENDNNNSSENIKQEEKSDDNKENIENPEKEIQITTSTQEESKISNEEKTEIIEETGKKGDSDLYEIQEGEDSVKIATIKSSVKYKVAFAGMIKNKVPEKEELDDILEKNHPKYAGIWVKSESQSEFLKYISSVTKSEYEINENGYLKIKNKKNQNEYDKKIEEIINGNKLYIIDISSTCYIVDEITGEILDYNFEDMDEYQTYQYFEDGDKKIIFITENQNNQLTVKEIIESVIELF